MYLGDIEVFRTSTSEPTASGVTWTYFKNMDNYLALWREKQTLIFDLPNVVDATYTGILNTTLTATFFTIPDLADPADTILPISAEGSANNNPSAFMLEQGKPAITSQKFPPNVKRAVVSLLATGQNTEEFWYSNVPSQDVDTFNETVGTLYGYTPFREVQLLIDGQLAGVSWPFPVIFTGGIVPGFWRPIAGIDAYDLRQNEIDITPFLGILSDGTNHEFEIRVVGINDDDDANPTLTETVGYYWLVTGTIFLFSDKEGAVTTGSKPTFNTDPPKISLTSKVTQTAEGYNDTLTYITSVERTLSISSSIQTSAGTASATWSQHITYNNQNYLTSMGLNQLTIQTTSGSDSSSSGYQHDYNYPITVNSTIANPTTDLTINADLQYGLTYNVLGPTVFPNGVESFNHTRSTVSPSFQAGQNPSGIQIPLTSLKPLSGSNLITSVQGTATYETGNSIDSAILNITSLGDSSIDGSPVTVTGRSSPDLSDDDAMTGTLQKRISSDSGGVEDLSSTTTGTTTQTMDFEGVEYGSTSSLTELYSRKVMAQGGVVVLDNEKLVDVVVEEPVNAPPQAGMKAPSKVSSSSGETDGVVGSARSVLGRGPGANNKGIPLPGS